MMLSRDPPDIEVKRKHSASPLLLWFIQLKESVRYELFIIRKPHRGQMMDHIAKKHNISRNVSCL